MNTAVGAARLKVPREWPLSPVGSPHSHCFDRSTSPTITLSKGPIYPSHVLRTHTRLLRVNPAADLRLLEILPGRRNVSISLATRLEAGQRVTEFSHTPPKTYRISLIRVTGKAGFGWLSPFTPERGRERLLSGWPCIFILIPVCLGTIWTKSSSSGEPLEIILTGHSDFWSLYSPQACFQRWG